MSQIYSNPKRESETYSLPDVETFTLNYGDCPYCTSTVTEDACGEYRCESCQKGWNDATPAEITTGWFYWACFPGCMPDSDPMGPYATEAEAVAAAQEDAGEYEDEDAE